jgi:hypothetical protein
MLVRQLPVMLFIVCDDLCDGATVVRRVVRWRRTVVARI